MEIVIVQGEDMGMRSRLKAEIPPHSRQLDPRLRDSTANVSKVLESIRKPA